jgi:ribosome-associated protein
MTTPASSLTAEQLRDTALTALDDMKAKDVLCLDVKPLTSMADYMIVASGTSSRHVKACADRVLDEIRARGARPVGIEGAQAAEWVLVDLNDVIVHVMMPDTRRFYDLERLWTITPAGSGSRDA